MNKNTLTTITFLLVFVLILSACAPQAPRVNLGGTSWTLVSYGSVKDQTPAANSIQTSLIFGADGQVSGNLGCNGFSDNYMIRDGKLTFGPLASTLMACPGPQMTQEGSAFQVLAGTVSFILSGNNLTIFDRSGANALALSKVVH
jgi:heat shock protein HslJ